MDWRQADLGFVLPQVFVDTPVDMDVVRTVAQRAEAAGCHSLWTQSQVTGRADVLEPIGLLNYAAALTERIRLGTSVLIVTEHTPVQLAKMLSSLDNVSRGRLMIGLGIGSPRLRLVGQGMETDRPIGRLLETVQIMDALWADGPVTHHGRIWQFDDQDMNPKPVQRPRPPLWLGGSVPAALARAVKYGDGWMGPRASTIEAFREGVARLRAELAAIGRDPATFTIAKGVYVAVEDDSAEAERRLRARYAGYSGDPERVTQACVYGPPEVVSAKLQQIADAGAELIVLNPVYDFVRQQQRLFELAGRAVAPMGVPAGRP